MRSLGLSAILLALAAVVPPPSLRTEFEPLWALGALVLLAVTAQRTLAGVRLPALVGWIGAAVVLGPSALAVVGLSRLPLLTLVGAVAGVLAGLLVGLGVSWPPQRRSWRVPVVVAASTLVTFALLTGAIGLVSDLPWPAVLVFAAVASLWGPVVADLWRSRETQVIGLFGVGGGLLVLSTVVLLGSGDPGGGVSWVARLVLAAGGGALGAEAMWRLRVLERRDSALLGLGCLTALSAFVAVDQVLPTLPIGLGAGLVLAGHEGTVRQLGNLLAPARSIAILLFTALLVASTDAVAALWPPTPGLYEIVLVQLAVLACVRGVGPAFWYPLPASARFSRRSGWLLMPKGLIAGELVLGVDAGLPHLLGSPHGELLRKVVIVDLLLYALVFASLATLVPARADVATSADDAPLEAA